MRRVWAFEEIDLKEYLLLRRGVVRAAGRAAEAQRLSVQRKVASRIIQREPELVERILRALPGDRELLLSPTFQPTANNPPHWRR